MPLLQRYLDPYAYGHGMDHDGYADHRYSHEGDHDQEWQDEYSYYDPEHHGYGHHTDYYGPNYYGFEHSYVTTDPLTAAHHFDPEDTHHGAPHYE